MDRSPFRQQPILIAPQSGESEDRQRRKFTAICAIKQARPSCWSIVAGVAARGFWWMSGFAAFAVSREGFVVRKVMVELETGVVSRFVRE
jgi:hypothetical protein